ncbi:hypothetical protein [Microbacterium sp. SSM24]|uniref:hypothetical protein n=1 Tax=Microbacterium sp. SSM24 TaxID=2991714 RepID=UPI002225D87D|nr:hypothetical protein [Microbacterium sp. SSM24]MCW3493325.1 hypothetical protein [Microbacterium sp. SSM24]
MLGPLFWWWFKATTHEERTWQYPAGPSVVKVDGIDPVRVLVVGDGPAAGCGVLIHELGLAGYLARHLAEQLARGVEVTVSAEPTASARSTLMRIGAMDLDRFDSIVLMLATTDAFCLTPRRSWQHSMTALIQALRAADTSSVFVTSTASMHLTKSLSPFARRLTGSHARKLNIETSLICAHSRTPMIALDDVNDLTPFTYEMWGRRIGERISRVLIREAPIGTRRGARVDL